ncbi:MAG: tripartite tricarboxylate transporter substrate binding protein [Burkholderiales bacterium]|nr:tripartite tricarboxylate transporter substrate binding protein [Burkholderiales bacterium]
MQPRSVPAPVRVARRLHRVLAFGVLAAAHLAPPAAFAQAYPSRAITVIVTTTPGTGIDVLARALAQKLVERWNTGVAVENRFGASGNIGAEFVARAAPDGHTLLMAPTTFLTNTTVNRGLSIDPVKSFTPVALLATGTLALVVSINTPAQSAKEFVAMAKARPGAYNYASNGNGSLQHLAFELFKQEAGIDVTHVPYKSNGPAYNDLLGGRVNAMVTTINSSIAHVKAGKMRLLAVMDDTRSALHPGTPTIGETGFKGLDIAPWNAMLGPAGLPAEIVRSLNNEVNAILDLAEVGQLLEKQGLNRVGGPPSRLEDLLRREQARWRKVVAAAGIKPD